MDENKIIQLMKTLDLSREEAIELLQEDTKIDKMSMKEVDNDLTPEQKQAIKKAKGGIRAVNAYGKTVVRQRKENPTKASLIAEIAKFLKTNCKNVIKNCEITNKERQIIFECGENKFELTLVQKRPPKKK